MVRALYRRCWAPVEQRHSKSVMMMIDDDDDCQCLYIRFWLLYRACARSGSGKWSGQRERGLKNTVELEWEPRGSWSCSAEERVYIGRRRAISLRLLERCQIRMDYGGVRKCLILGLRKTISSVLFLLMISLFSLDHSSMCETSVARSTGEFSATSTWSKVVYCICKDVVCSPIFH